MRLMSFLMVLSFTTLCVARVCETHKQPIALPSITKVTRVDVTFFNLTTGKGDDLLTSITAAEEVASVIKLVNAHLLSKSDMGSEWCRISRVQDKSTILNLSFYEGDEYKGTCGIGPDGDGGFFLKYHHYGQSKVKCLSSKEKKEFLGVIAVSEEKYQGLFKRL